MSWEWSQRATFTYYVLVAVLELILKKIIFSAPSHEWHTTSQLLLPARRSQNRMMTSSANRPPSSHRNSQDRRTLKRAKQIPSELRITEPVEFVVATAP